MVNFVFFSQPPDSPVFLVSFPLFTQLHAHLRTLSHLSSPCSLFSPLFFYSLSPSSLLCSIFPFISAWLTLLRPLTHLQIVQRSQLCYKSTQQALTLCQIVEVQLGLLFFLVFPILNYSSAFQHCTVTWLFDLFGLLRFVDSLSCTFELCLCLLPCCTL